jgi:hypothetical protein
MRKYIPALLAAAVIVFGAASCKEKKKSDDIIVAKYVPEGPGDPIRMSVDKRTTNVEWLGKSYIVEITRTPSDSLPMLKDETGQQYVDNSVSLTIKRSDGSKFMSHIFTKNAFNSYIDASFRATGCLENVVFHGVENNLLTFGAVVSRAGSDDEFVPIDIKIDRNGGISMSLGQLFDRDDELQNNEE